MDVSLQQMRAARALLDWKQSDLAAASGLSLPTIAKIESGFVHPRSDTLAAIRAAFEQNGIEFTDAPGVQMRQDAFAVELRHGREAVVHLWQDIENTLASGGELLISGVDEPMYVREFGDLFCATLRKRWRLKIRPRILIREGDPNIIVGADVYRAVPEAIGAGLTPYYIYRDKMAIIQFEPTVRAIMIEGKAVAETFRAQFEYHWQNGKILYDKDMRVIHPPENFAWV